MAADPTAAYRKQQGLAPITQSFDPTVVSWIVKAAKQTGADPAALLATSIQESGARLHGPAGDSGTSFGPFQFHIGGALANHPPAWASTYPAVLNRAQEFRRLQVHGGPGAAAVQKPLDRTLYAQGVNSHLAQARAILAKYGLTTPTTTSTVTPSTPVVPAASTPTTPAPLITANRVLTNDTADIGTSMLQSLIDANAQNAGIQSIQLPIRPTIPTLTTPTLTPANTKKPKPTTSLGAGLGKPGGGWMGSHNLALAMAAIGKRNGLSIASEKRQRKLTASGNPSDHWVGSKGSYAFDLSNGGSPTPQMDATATQIAAALGVPNYHGGRILNIIKGGYRYQLLWRVGGHYDHVHIGVRKV